MTDDLVPATSIQERMWFAERIDAGTGLYNVPFAWRVTGTLSSAAVTRALALVIERHEILRTSFVERDGRLYQLVGEPWTPELERVDLRGTPDAEAELAAWLRDAAREPFDVGTSELLRVGLVDLDGEQVLFLCAHHLVWDASSLPVFLRDLRAGYEAASDDSEGGPRDWAALDLPSLDAERLLTVGRQMAEWLRPQAPAALGDGEFPASAHQERMAFIDRFEKGVVYETSPIYHNLPLILRVPAVPDRTSLDARLSTVVNRHEVLRTNLFVAEDGVRQRVTPAREPRAEWLPVGDGQPSAALLSWIRTPLDLERDSLFRVAVQPLGDGSAVIALVGHQSVVDRPSLVVLAEEIVGEAEGEPTSYLDWLARNDKDEIATDYAAQTGALRGEIEAIAFPERRVRDAVHVYQEQSVPVEVSSDLVAAAARLGVDVDALLLAAFHTVLTGYTGQYELMIGTVHSRRGPADTRVVGPLSNLVPVRLNTAPDAEFRSLAETTASALSFAARHCHAQFDNLVRLINPAKDMSRTALFDVLFHYVPEPARPDEVGWFGGYGKYDLHLFLRPNGNGATGRVIYNELYFDHDQIALFAEHFVRVVEQAVTEPATAIAGFELLTEPERHTQLVDWNATWAGYPDATIHGLVSQQAQAFPDRVAVTSSLDSRTYQELIDTASRIARSLVARGVRPGELVALVLERGVAQVEAMLGVLMAGAAYLPIEPSIPAERKEFILGDSETRWVIADGDVSGTTTVRVAELAGETHDVALPEVTPDSLAYCIYTSGTTGRPKGCLVTHRNVVRLVRNETFPFEFNSDDVWTMFHSYSFDFSVWEVFCCLAYGSRLVVVAGDEAKDTQRFLELLRRERVTVLNQTPSAFAQLTVHAMADNGNLDHLRYVIFGGEALAPGKLAEWARRQPDLRLINMYGITETTVHTTVRQVSQADIDGDISNIGVPIPTTTTYLFDRNNPRRLLPVGAIGELYVGGDGVAAGYLKRPELNAERFIADPFSDGRLFRSGDLGRYRPDGTMEYLGRGDSQIKLRGFRIELGEIESCLREHPGVADAVVLLEGGSEGRLVAYLRSPSGLPDLTELRAHLASRLPTYMVPAELNLVESFPLTGNGKLDKKALRALGVALSSGKQRAPETATGRLVADIMSRLLKIPSPGADDSFFDLGGHSLLATKLVGEIAATTGVQLSLRDLFQRPQVQDLADYIDAQAPEEVVTLAEEPVGDVGAPVSDTQGQMWLAERMSHGEPSHNVPLLWKLTGSVVPERLRSAFAGLIERHEILRTAFREIGGQPRQIISEPWVPELGHDDLRGLTDAERIDKVNALVDREARTPFDLESGRLLRVHLIECAPGEQLLLVCLHHIVFDGGSIPVFINDLAHAYNGTLAELPAPVQFTEVVRRQQELLAGPDGELGLEHWADYLAGAPSSLDLCPPPARAGSHGAVRVPFSPDFASSAAGLLGEYRVSWYMVAVAAVAALLHRWSGSDDVTFGLPVANRDDEDDAEVLGPCLNTVVLRSKCKQGMSFGDLIAAVRESMLDAFEFQGVPLPQVVERLDPPRRPGRSPYLDVALNLVADNGSGQPFGAGTITTLPFDRWQHETKFGLTVTFIDDGGRLGAVLSYRGDRYSETDVTRMASWLGKLLDDVSSHVGAPLETVMPAAGAQQYRDFALAQAARAADTAGVDHWVSILDGSQAYPHVNPPLHTGPPGAVSVDLGSDVLDGLRAVRAEHGVSWFMVAATALAALLHRWTGQEDVTFGCPVANRDEFAEVLGPCLNTVVLRSECAEETTVLELLNTMRDHVLDAFDHQWVPFEDIVNRLNPPRRPGWTPFIDILLAVTTGDAPPAVLGGVELRPVALDHDGAGYAGKFGLTVGFEEVDGRLRGTVMYRGDRFTAGEVARIARWLGRFLTSFTSVLDRPVSTLDLMDAVELAELARIEHGPPATEVTSIPALVAQQCASRPDAVAIRTSRGVRTYRDLDRRSDAVAAKLRALAHGDHPVVALLLPRGEELVYAMLGAWKAGFLYCPLEPEYPAERIRFIVGDLDACAVLTDNPSAARAACGDGVAVIDIAAVGEGAEAAGSLPSPDATAYVLYTSGTTGEPKGVEYSHRALAQATQWHHQAFDVTSSDRVSWVHSVAFDTTEWEIWMPLSVGAELLPYEPTSVVAPELEAWMDAERITVFCTPTPLAEVMWAHHAALPALRWLIFGGSALTVLPPASTNYRIANSYGPTETYNTTIQPLEPATEVVLNRIGRPNAGVRIYVLDSNGRRTSIGIPGEIHIAGTSVAKGYWRRPEMTAARFASLTPDGEPGPVYRTGDRGRWLPDGSLEYLGRFDRQVKVRGYRVEPAEIESQLRNDPLVTQAIVQHFPGEPVPLVGYLVPHEGGETDTQAVLARLKATLPEFMIPGGLVWLPELPLNSRGKLDTKALPRPDRDALATATPWTAPETDTERRIAAVWSAVLGLETVGAHDNFFDLGGNSLLLAKLHARLQAELETTLPIRQLFEYPTVHTLAQALTSGPATDAATSAKAQDRASQARASRARRARPGR
jgi:amino acid adenylation domain-containing protein